MKRLLLLALTLGLVLTAAVAHAGKLDEIKQRGTLVCGVKDSVVPFGFIDETSKQLVGFDVDICQFIADRAGVKLEVKTVTSATRIPMLTQGSVDLVAATMTHKFERDDVIDFSITYFFDGQKVLAKKGQFKSVKDMVGKKIATMQGTTSEVNVKRALKEAGDPNPDQSVISFQKESECFQALQMGRVAGWSTDASILVGYSAKEPGKFELVGNFLAEEPYGIAMPQDDSALRDAVNAALQDMWKDGTYKTIYNKWYGPGTPFEMPLAGQIEMWP